MQAVVYYVRNGGIAFAVPLLTHHLRDKVQLLARIASAAVHAALPARRRFNGCYHLDLLRLGRGLGLACGLGLFCGLWGAFRRVPQLYVFHKHKALPLADPYPVPVARLARDRHLAVLLVFPDDLVILSRAGAQVYALGIDITCGIIHILNCVLRLVRRIRGVRRNGRRGRACGVLGDVPVHRIWVFRRGRRQRGLAYFDFDRGYGRPWSRQVKERFAIFQGTLLRCNKHPLRLCFEDGIGGGGGLHAAGAGQQHCHGDDTYCSKLACHLPLSGIRE